MVPTADRSGPILLIAAARRILEGLLTAWAAVSLTFFSLRLAAGDPVASLLSQGLATSEQAESLRHSLGLDAPLLLQYLRYLGRLIQGNLGVSLYTQRPVSKVILEQLPNTAQLAMQGLLLAILLGLILGLASAWLRNAAGRLAANLAGLSTSLPVAFLGILILWGCRNLYLLGQTTAISPNLLAPLVLGIASAGPIARVIHSGLEDSIQSPYFLAARARGIRRGPRLLWHALRPALPAAVSLLALEAAFLFSGTVVTETVFSRPGLGRLLVSAILQGDFPVAEGLVILAALLYTASHVLSDLIAMMLDPRLRRAG